MSRSSSRLTRYGDFAGILLVLGGFLAYLWSEGAFRLLERRAGAPGGIGSGAVAAADQIRGLSRIGLALVAAGLLVLVLMAVVQWRERQRANRA